MKKIICFAFSLLLLMALTLPAAAESEAPVITMQPQSPTYLPYSTALYICKVDGTNLTATWYMDYMGKTYTISEFGGAMQPWEAFAGEEYGAKKLDDNTFAFLFGGIEMDLDGAYIWCVVEDGHYDVTSQKTRISVAEYGTPPEILSVPTGLTVEQGEEAEIRCVAKAPEGMQLSFRWYETDTGKREDMYAVNDGAETSDYMFCDTSKVGTRNYLCIVETSEGGLAFTSLVPVTVTEKAATQPKPDETNPATQPVPPETQPQATTPATQPQATTPATQPDPTTNNPEPTEGTQPAPTAPQKAPEKTSGDIPWWAVALVGLAAIGGGVGVAFLLVRKKQ